MTQSILNKCFTVGGGQIFKLSKYSYKEIERKNMLEAR